MTEETHDVTTTLHVVGEDDWSRFREVRLRALADAPDAFGVTLAEATANPESVWRARARGPGPTLLALSGDRAVAMGGLFTPEGARDAFVWGMWVEPGWRGRGVGAQLLRRLLAHAHDTGRAVVLDVTEGNDTARGLYERHGFVSTGDRRPLRDGSQVRVETMRRAGAGPAVGGLTP